MSKIFVYPYLYKSWSANNLKTKTKENKKYSIYIYQQDSNQKTILAYLKLAVPISYHINQDRMTASTCSMTRHPCILILADFAFSKNVAKVYKYFIISGCNISGSGFLKRIIFYSEMYINYRFLSGKRRPRKIISLIICELNIFASNADCCYI